MFEEEDGYSSDDSSNLLESDSVDDSDNKENEGAGENDGDPLLIPRYFATRQAIRTVQLSQELINEVGVNYARNVYRNAYLVLWDIADNIKIADTIQIMEHTTNRLTEIHRFFEDHLDRWRTGQMHEMPNIRIVLHSSPQ